MVQLGLKKHSIQKKIYTPNNDYFVSVGLQRTNRKIGKIVTLYHPELMLGYILTTSVLRVNSGVTTVTLFCSIWLLYSCTPKWNLLCFSFTFPFLRDLSWLAYFSSNLYACLSVRCSVHCNFYFHQIPSHLLFCSVVRFLMHWNLLLSSGCQVITS